MAGGFALLANGAFAYLHYLAFIHAIRPLLVALALRAEKGRKGDHLSVHGPSE
jgi:hypothetical protein